MPLLNTGVMKINGAFGPCAAKVPVHRREAGRAPLRAASAVNVEALVMLLVLYKEPHANISCPEELTSQHSRAQPAGKTVAPRAAGGRVHLTKTASLVPLPGYQEGEVPCGKPLTQKGW